MVKLLCFNGISAFLGYLMPHSSFLMNRSSSVEPTDGEYKVFKFDKGIGP